MKSNESEVTVASLTEALAASPIATLMADSELRIRWRNAAAEALFEGELSEAEGLPELVEAVNASSPSFATILRSYRDGEHMAGVELRYIQGPQERRLTYLSTPITSGDLAGGRVERFVDLTSRTLRQDQVYQSEKMEAIGRIAGTVAHDFNNFLTAINGYSQLLERVLPDDGPRRYVEEIRKAGQRAAGMAANLLRISRRQVVHPELVDLGAMIAKREELLRRTVGDTVRLKLDLEANAGNILADPKQLEGALMNLADNALEAMPDGGDLLFKLTREVLEHSRGKIPPGTYARLDVQDTGVGIPPDVIPHIYEPLFSTKDKGKGTGFGLAIVYAAIARSNGYIEVDSTVGEGTTFSIFVPTQAA